MWETARDKEVRAPLESCIYVLPAEADPRAWAQFLLEDDAVSLLIVRQDTSRDWTCSTRPALYDSTTYCSSLSCNREMTTIHPSWLRSQ